VTLLDSDRGHMDETVAEFFAKKRAEKNGNSAVGQDAELRADAFEAASPVILSIGMLIAQNPALSPPVIQGLLRIGETANIIAAPKAGKSWLANALALATATGGDWLGRQCGPGVF